MFLGNYSSFGVISYREREREIEIEIERGRERESEKHKKWKRSQPQIMRQIAITNIFSAARAGSNVLIKFHQSLTTTMLKLKALWLGGPSHDFFKPIRVLNFSIASYAMQKFVQNLAYPIRLFKN